MTKSMYNTMLELPLFQGLGQNDLTRIVESTHLDFRSAMNGRTLFRQGDLCEGLTFVIEGSFTVITTSADGTWQVEEMLEAPAVIGLDVLYGSQRTYRRTYVARQTSRLVFLTKQSVSAFIRFFDVFRINVMNMLTTQAVRTDAPHWLPGEKTLEGRIVHFLLTHVSRPAGPKRFLISQHQLGRYLGVAPRYISAALHNMHEHKLLRAERRAIEVDAFENLLRDFRYFKNEIPQSEPPTEDGMLPF